MKEQVPGWHNLLGKKATIKYLPFKGAGAPGWAPVIRLKTNRGNRFVRPICTIQPLAFAGLWEAWQPGDFDDDQSTYNSCTIITREASSSVRGIHHRMPVILKPEAYDRWLNPEIQQSEYLQNIIDTEYIRELKYFPVSKMVNRVQNNTPECIKPLG